MIGVQLSVKTGKICPAEKCFLKNKAEKDPLLKRHFHMNDEAMDVFLKVIDDFLFPPQRIIHAVYLSSEKTAGARATDVITLLLEGKK